MLKKLLQRQRDAASLGQLLLEAERLANAEGQHEPGAEHLMLAAMGLDDGTARRAFERVGADPFRFRDAIDKQYADALGSVGLKLAPGLEVNCTPAAVAPGQGLDQAKPSVTAVVKRLSDESALQVPAHPLLGAHVILAAAHAEHTTAVRALRAMGVEPRALAEAARAEIRDRLGAESLS